MTGRTYFRIVGQWLIGQLEAAGDWLFGTGQRDPAADPEEDGEGIYDGYSPHHPDLEGGIFNF